jgi:molecular chaperone IbpA
LRTAAERLPKTRFIFRSSGDCLSSGKFLEIDGRYTQIDAAAADTGVAGHTEKPGWVSERAKRKAMLLKGEQTMRHVDFSPLYRSTVGFDRLFTMLDSLAQPEGGQSYPPYNIERTGEDAYRISMAVAGFSENEISIEAHRNVLTVKGERKEETNEGSEVLYRGIASRAFERRFQLADHVEVTGASLKNGLLHIDLKRNIPEEMKPRKVEISAASAKTAKQIEAKAA